MTATNDMTGDRIVSKANSDKYRNSHDRIFGKRLTAIAKTKPKRAKK